MRVMRYVWAALTLACWTCPGGAGAQSGECLECHADPELAREADHRPGTSVYVDETDLERSVHEGMDCIDCHPDASDDHTEKLEAAACADCHDDAVAAFDAGLHGQALKAGNPAAPGCAACHGSHGILPSEDTESATFPAKTPHTCAACHADAEFIDLRQRAYVSPLQGYEQSVHFGALNSTPAGATCTDCHEYHALRRAMDPQSTIYRPNIPETCGKCHGEVRQIYEESIHGRALRLGGVDAPTCIDCHGEHEIRGPADPQSDVYPTHIAKTTCVWCHESERIVKRYGLPAQRLSTYADSYHGLADQSGSTVVANCASCHGIHDIRPSDEPESSIHPHNLPATCGVCHPGAGDNFAQGQIHVVPGTDNGEHFLIFLVRQFYIILIVVTVAGMAVHNGLDLVRKFGSARLPLGWDYLRFSLTERLQHGALALSFIVLAYTGFALKFPQAWWAIPLTWLDGGEESRRWIHRIGAVVMVALCIYHLAYVCISERGRAQMAAMRPRMRDLRDVAEAARYYLGRASHGPSFGRFGYIEKLEYWALVWGSAVMTATGFVLWFENQSLQIIPKWGLDVATVIHYYEAWLATLAIVVWHLYWVIFNPSVYPMSLVWWRGHLSEEAMEHEHPLELSEIREGRRR